MLDERGIDRAVLAGASMGAHTLLRFALDHPERALALVVITPAYDPESFPGDLVRWDALAEGLRARWRRGLRRGLRPDHRALGGDDREGAAPAAEPARAPGGGGAGVAAGAALAAVRVARGARVALDAGNVVAEPRRGRPGPSARVGEAYARTIPGARLVTEDEGSSPLAWQGGQLSRVIAEAAA